MESDLPNEESPAFNNSPNQDLNNVPSMGQEISGMADPGEMNAQIPSMEHGMPSVPSPDQMDTQMPSMRQAVTGSTGMNPQMLAHMQQQQQMRQEGEQKKRKKVLLAVVLAVVLVAAGAGGVWAMIAQPWKTDDEVAQDNTGTSADENEGNDDSQGVVGGPVISSDDCATEVAYVPDYVTEEAYELYKTQVASAYETLSDQLQQLRDMGMDEDARQTEAIMQAYQREMERSFEEYRELYTVKKATSGYVCPKDWGVKIKIPEGLRDVEYMVTQTPGIAEQLMIVGAMVGDKYVGMNDYGDAGVLAQSFALGTAVWVNFAEVKTGCGYQHCYFGGLERPSDEELSGLRARAVYEKGDYGVIVGDAEAKEAILQMLSMAGATEAEIDEVRQAQDKVMDMLTNRENYYE